MSWDAYVANNLMCPVDEKGNTLASGALLGLDGSVWAKSAEFPDVNTDEIQGMKAILEGKGTGSVTIGGTKFILYNSDDRLFRGRGVGANSALGVVAQKTNTALVVGLHKEEVVKAPVALTIVNALAEYLDGIGY